MRRLPLVLFAGAVLLLACSLGSSAVTETPTRAPLLVTPRPTLPPIKAQSATTAPAPTDEPLATLEPPSKQEKSAFFSDDFSDPNSGWIVDSIPNGSVGYDQGKYVIKVKKDQYTLWSHVGKLFDDVTVDVMAQSATPTVDTEMGVLCRYEDKDNFVYASISSDGYYGIGQVKQGDVRIFTGSGKLQPTDAIQPGGALNHLQLVCNGDTFTLIVNDQVIDSAQATAATSGDVGLLAGTFDKPNATVHFDDFATAAPLTDLSGQTGGQILYQDDFSDAQSGWDVRETDNGASGYRAGRYFIRVNMPNYRLWSLPGQSFDGAVNVEVTAGLSSGPQENEMGVICHYQDKANFMYASIGADGYYAIGQKKNDKSTLLTGNGKFVPSDAIPVGSESYHIRLACEAGTYTLFVNGELIDSATSTAFTGGEVGLLAGTFDTGGVEVVYDDLVVSAP